MDPRVIVKEEDEVFCCDDPEYPLINTADHSLNDRTRASDIVTLKVDPNTMCIKVEPCIADHEFKTEFSDTELKEELLPPNIEQAEVKTDEIFESLSDCEKEEEHDSMDKKQPSPTSTNSKQARKHQSDSRKTLNNTQFYICHECGHKSKQKTALKLHMLTHMDPAHVTWYKCELCPYASKLKGGLNVHMLSHKTITENVSNAEHKNEINGPVESQEKARGYVLLSSNSTFTETESDDDTANNEYINRSDLDFDISPRDQAKKQRYLSEHCEQPIRCNFCDKDVTPKDFSRHVEPCHETKIEVRNILRSPKNSKRRMHAFGLLGNIVSSPKSRKSSLVPKEDLLITHFGQSYLKKQQEVITYECNTKMKELALLLKNYQKATGNKKASLKDMLLPSKFNEVLSAIRDLAGYDPLKRTVESPSLVVNLAISLKYVCEELICLITEDCEGFESNSKVAKEKWICDVETFIDLVNTHWSTELASLMYRNSEMRSLKLPLVADVKTVGDESLRPAKEEVPPTEQSKPLPLQVTTTNIQRTRWTNEEVELVMKEFKQYIDEGKYPPGKEIDIFIKKYNINRTICVIKSKIQHIMNTKKKRILKYCSENEDDIFSDLIYPRKKHKQ